jgi:DNA-binding response OmpR family regulator
MAETQGNGVLIVEDEDQIRVLVALLFELEQFTVYQAINGREALETFLHHRDQIALLITDLGLPEMGGLELVQRVREAKPTVRIIGTSGFGRQNVREELLKAGGDEFVPKPFAADDLIKMSKQLLGRA